MCIVIGMNFLMSACYIKEMTTFETSGKTAMMFPLEMYLGRLCAEFLISKMDKQDLFNFENSVILCAIPFCLSILGLLLFLLSFKVETPHFCRLLGSQSFTVPLAILYTDENRKNEEKDYLDKMYDSGVLRKYSINLRILLNSIRIFIRNI